MRIQHNIMAMGAYRNYTNNVAAMKKNLEKLSSGYKINRAGDDAAGLAISEKMRAQITGLEAAQKNAKDGISLVQTAEGALTEVHDMLNRMVELATQSANGTYDNTTDRAQLQKELGQLRTEIDRIADSSNFNGIKLLDGSMDRNAVTQNTVTVNAIADGDQSVVNGAKGVYTFDLKDYKTGGTASAGGTFEAGTKTTETKNATATGTAVAAVSDWTDTTGLTLAGDGTEKVSVQLGDKTYDLKLVKTGSGDGGAAADDEVIVTGTESPADLVKKLETRLNELVDADNKAGAAGTSDYKKIENVKLAADGADKGKLVASADVTPMTYKTNDTTPGKGTFEAGTTQTNQNVTVDGTKAADYSNTDWTDTTTGTGQDDAFDGQSVKFTVGGKDFTVKLVKTGTGNAGAAAADEVVVGATDSNNDIAKAIEANLKAQVAAHNKAGEEGTTDYVKIENVVLTPADKSFTVKADTTAMTYKDPAAKAAAQPAAQANAPAAGGDYKITVGGVDLTLDDSKLSGTTITGDMLAKAIDTSVAVNINGMDYDISVNGTKVTLTARDVPTDASQIMTDLSVQVTDKGNNNSWDRGLHAVTPAAVDNGQKVAQGEFTLTEAMVQDGNTLTIGDTTYTFRVGRTGTGAGDNVIDLSSYDVGDTNLLTAAAEKLSQMGNSMFDVTTSGSGVITLTEKMGAVDYTKDWNLKGTDNAVDPADGKWNVPASSGPRKNGVVTTAVGNGRGLTLQIGDTADTFNQLRVSIGDTHADALGIGNISIADQNSAAAAIDKIKAAINYVSDIRGTLGATQNRLDHTINNLSVMTENIQDAESTIRDTDVAAEMMEYTKNNILIQSAQAMLAQANQVPQGVLQLLQ